MGIGFRLDWKWRFPVKSSLITNSSSTRQFSYTENTARGGVTSHEPAKVSLLSVIPDEIETIYKDSLKVYTCSTGALQMMENGSVEMEELKMSIGGGSKRIPFSPIDDINLPEKDKMFALCSSLKTSKTSYFSLLMESLERVEEISVDADFVRLERDILIQLGKLGALQLFQACLLRNVHTRTTLSLSLPLSKLLRDSPFHGAVDDRVDNVIVSSGRKKWRKSKRERALEKDAKIYVLSPALKEISRASQRATVSSNAKSRRSIIARNESEMATGVKDLANLERTKATLEEDIGRVASLHNWAEAAGLDEKMLQQRLYFGWYCRDELLKSTRSLVMYLARSHRGLGISLEDLLQAGNMGVLQGAERFDHTRGYRFSTYVQYWIKKSMATVVQQHSRLIKIPVGLNKAVCQIQNARKILYSRNGRYPDDAELARYTGLSLAKISSASKCPRIVGSISQKMGDNLSVKYMEFTSDTSVKTPEEMVMRQHVQQDIYNLLHGLHPRERQVLLLRNGIGSGQCRSLEEIGKIFNVTKEWIRKIEKSALKKVSKFQSSRRTLETGYQGVEVYTAHSILEMAMLVELP